MLSRLIHKDVVIGRHRATIYYYSSPRGPVVEEVIVYGRKVLRGKPLKKLKQSRLRKIAERLLTGEKGECKNGTA
jgi:hypothetical protein